MTACFRLAVVRAEGLGFLMDENDQFVQSGFLVHVPGVTDFSTCAFVVESGATSGANAWQELGNLSVQNAEVIGAGVVLVWAIAWGFRVISKMLLNDGVSND